MFKIFSLVVGLCATQLAINVSETKGNIHFSLTITVFPYLFRIHMASVFIKSGFFEV